MRSTHAPKVCITDEVCITHEVCLSFRKERITEKSDLLSQVAFFMERVTRLELATSTLARWRSTG